MLEVEEVPVTRQTAGSTCADNCLGNDVVLDGRKSGGWLLDGRKTCWR